MATLSHSEFGVPYGPLAVALLRGADLSPKPDAAMARDAIPFMTFPSGEKLTGIASLLRYASRVGSGAELYPSSPVDATLVDQWVDFACASITSGVTFEPTLAALDAYLSTRTFFVGHSITLADVAVWHALVSARQWEVARKSADKIPHLLRWFTHAQGSCAALPDATARTKYQPQKLAVKAAKKEIHAAAGADGAGGAAKKEGGSFDIDLKDAEMGKVCTRFPPEPSGYLHIGHAKAALLNDYFARTYKGRLIVRFDDTNPAKENEDFVQSIHQDIATLGIKPDVVTYTSDHFSALLEMAAQLLKEGKAYIDNTPVDKMREERMEGIESACRNNSVETNLKMWEEMVKGSPEGCKCCLRLKIDMKADNKTLRDPVGYRCNVENAHHRTGTKFKVYPTYDFACPFVDAVEGVTHALRTSEYKDREAQYIWIQAAMGLRKVHIWEYSRLNFEYTTLSKRKLLWFVEEGLVGGWDDPRFPTVRGACRRGLTVAALREFILLQGASKNDNTMTWDKLWTMNKKVIDPVCPRFTAVSAARVPVTLTNGPKDNEVVAVPKHKKYPPAGEKRSVRSSRLWIDLADAQAVSEGEEVTLMDWGNCIFKKVAKGADGAVTGIEGELHLEGDVKKTKLKLTWLADIPDLVDLELEEYDHLITKRKMEDGDKLEDFVNKNSRKVAPAYGCGNLREVKKGDILQLERKGYYIVDRALEAGKPVVLVNIPDGRTK